MLNNILIKTIHLMLRRTLQSDVIKDPLGVSIGFILRPKI
jgi:hypothetical protein